MFVVAGRDAGDVGRVERVLTGSNGTFAYFHDRVRRRERPLDDHLGRRVLDLALREPGRVLETGRIEERMGRVEAVVDDPDLHAVPGGLEVRAPQGVRRRSRPSRPVSADGERVVAHVRPDLRDARDRGEQRRRRERGTTTAKPSATRW